ncbi:hypothetical protein Bbelb_097830 [Branchiostoma belcheri]|nr:hypothetical protein Bbelb_097830 [Branchiostoma belcheri]
METFERQTTRRTPSPSRCANERSARRLYDEFWSIAGAQEKSELCGASVSYSQSSPSRLTGTSVISSPWQPAPVAGNVGADVIIMALQRGLVETTGICCCSRTAKRGTSHRLMHKVRGRDWWGDYYPRLEDGQAVRDTDSKPREAGSLVPGFGSGWPLASTRPFYGTSVVSLERLASTRLQERLASTRLQERLASTRLQEAAGNKISGAW